MPGDAAGAFAFAEHGESSSLSGTAGAAPLSFLAGGTPAAAFGSSLGLSSLEAAGAEAAAAAGASLAAAAFEFSDFVDWARFGSSAAGGVGSVAPEKNHGKTFSLIIPGNDTCQLRCSVDRNIATKKK